MPKHYTAAPIDPPPEPVEIDARGDLDAAAQAKQRLGTNTAFVLWEGERKALVSGSVDDVRRLRAQTKTPAT